MDPQLSDLKQNKTCTGPTSEFPDWARRNCTPSDPELSTSISRSAFSVSLSSLFVFHSHCHSCTQRSFASICPCTRFAARSYLQLQSTHFQSPNHACQVYSRPGLRGPRQCRCRCADPGMCPEGYGVGPPKYSARLDSTATATPYNANNHQPHRQPCRPEVHLRFRLREDHLQPERCVRWQVRRCLEVLLQHLQGKWPQSR